ncbi:tetraspanin-31 [Plakobranchus ocellatus]|uniref:Tetraspanin-31 n=1 Tax=Plakobranchus ocellatus TaxID=259542 RepID=A0AAV3XYU8_9GAST|nr:tetraspanin-31 [Plakobranchus ocellatus]
MPPKFVCKTKRHSFKLPPSPPHHLSEFCLGLMLSHCVFLSSLRQQWAFDYFEFYVRWSKLIPNQPHSSHPQTRPRLDNFTPAKLSPLLGWEQYKIYTVHPQLRTRHCTVLGQELDK